MGNSQLQSAHFNKRAHHKKRGGALEGEGEQAQAEQAAEQAPAQAPAEPAPTNDKNCPCPCPSGEPAAEKPSVAQQAENKVKEGQAALIGAVTGKATDAKEAVVGTFQGLVGKANALVGNKEPEAAAAPAAGGGRRTRRRSRKHKKTKRSRKHKKAKRSRKPRRK